MEITVAFLDEQIASLKQEVEVRRRDFFQAQGALQLAEHLKGRLSMPEPIDGDALEVAPPD